MKDALWHKVMDRFHQTCTWPGCWRMATCIHEEPPRSLTKRTEETMFPLCQEDHEYVTAHRGEDQLLERLEMGRILVLEFYGDD